MPKFQLALIFAAVIALVGLDYLHAAWSAPTNNPPSGNIAAPINTGGEAQTKSGALGAGALSITGESQFNGTLKFPFKNTSAGALTEWNMQRNDGTGNFNIYLNSNGGNSPTRLTTGHALKELFNPGDGSYRFLGSGSGSTGSAISWSTIFRIFPDGRIGADQFCDVDGSNCRTSSTGDAGQYRWVTGDYGACSGATFNSECATAAEGAKTRDVYCYDIVNSQKVANRNCVTILKPESSTSCVVTRDYPMSCQR